MLRCLVVLPNAALAFRAICQFYVWLFMLQETFQGKQEELVN